MSSSRHDKFLWLLCPAYCGYNQILWPQVHFFLEVHFHSQPITKTLAQSVCSKLRYKPWFSLAYLANFQLPWSWCDQEPLKCHSVFRRFSVTHELFMHCQNCTFKWLQKCWSLQPVADPGRGRTGGPHWPQIGAAERALRSASTFLNQFNIAKSS